MLGLVEASVHDSCIQGDSAVSWEVRVANGVVVSIHERKVAEDMHLFPIGPVG